MEDDQVSLHPGPTCCFLTYNELSEGNTAAGANSLLEPLSL